MRAFFSLFIALIATQMAWAACDDNLPANGSRNDVLIIVNDNAIDSCEVGRYYANARNLGKNNILHVKIPASYYIGYEDFKKYRDQIIKALQARMAANGITVASCSSSTNKETAFYCQESINQIVSQAPIQYLVSTKGIPTLAFGVPSTDGDKSEAVSVDGYLRSNLGKYPADVNDGKIYISRIDGLTLNAATRLVDRAINTEQSGFFGNFVGIAGGNGAGPFSDSEVSYNQFAPANYRPILASPNVSSERLLESGSEHWRYFLGLFAEDALNCTGNNYSSFYLRNTGGQAPTTCKAQFVKGDGSDFSEAAPGVSDSRIPTPTNVGMFMLNLAGQSTYATASDPLSALLNWKKSSAALSQDTLCQPGDTVCKNASEDPFKEIDTRNVGLADGAIGFHLISYPVTYMSSWPTAWGTTSSADNVTDTTLYPIPWLVLPVVDTTDGRNDLYSVAFRSNQSLATTSCYANTDLTSTTACTEKLVLRLSQRIAFSTPLILPTANPTMQVKLWYKSRSEIGAPASNVSIVLASRAQGKQVRLGVGTLMANGSAVQAGSNKSQWTQASVNIPLNFSSFSPSGNTVSLPSLLISIEAGEFSGEFKIDDIEIIDGNNQSIAPTNSSFNQGNKQFGTGDWAATFTSRLNGAAFWGSVTHNCGGQPFSKKAATSMVNLLAGTPLAKAVWDSEKCSGGVLYGDPLYSPMSLNIRAGANATSQSVIQSGQLPVLIDAFNGASGITTSQYKIEVCHSSPSNQYADFFVCDREGSWVPTGISGNSGGKNISATLNASQYSPTTPHTLRLTVTTKKISTNVSKTYQYFLTFAGKYLTLNNPDLNADSDGDHLSNGYELQTSMTDPTDIDSDNDNLIDGDEVNIYLSNPNLSDSDGNGLTDFQEVSNGTLPKNYFEPYEIPAILQRLLLPN